MRFERFVISLYFALIGCDDRSSSSSSPTPPSPATPMNTTSAPADMNKYPYLVADGGPHMLLPAEAAGAWTGASSLAAVTNPSSDYGRACAATANSQMTLIPVGSSSAMVFSDPPMTAWGKSSDGSVEVYYLKSWTSTNLDALIAKATTSLTTASLTDSGKTLVLRDVDAFLLFAGDTPTSTAYGVHRVTIPPGKYKILIGTYAAQGESVTIYRLKP
jgi:hypothetical protein